MSDPYQETMSIVAEREPVPGPAAGAQPVSPVADEPVAAMESMAFEEARPTQPSARIGKWDLAGALVGLACLLSLLTIQFMESRFYQTSPSVWPEPSDGSGTAGPRGALSPVAPAKDAATPSKDPVSAQTGAVSALNALLGPPLATPHARPSR